MISRLKKWVHSVYHQLVEINDTPQRTALGLGMGVFLGIFPGMGPIAALIASVIFRVNRAAALLGSLLTNTWVSVITFVLAVKIGAWITGAEWQAVYDQCRALLKDFHWDKLWDASVWKIFEPLVIGYAVIGLAMGVVAYLAALFFLLRREQIRRRRSN